MDKEFVNCKNGLTTYCPHYNGPAMNKLLMQTLENNPVDYFAEEDLKQANSLCNECKSFVPVEDQ